MLPVSSREPRPSGSAEHAGALGRAARAGPRRPFCLDPERLRRTFHAEYARVWRHLRRLGVPTRAIDDVTQQVFLVLARKIEHVVEGSERSYLFAVARRIAKDVRGAEVRDRADELVDLADDPENAPDVLLDEKRKLELLARILDAIERDLRTVFVLHELESSTVRDIADRLGIPAGTAASRLRRARADFAARVDRRLRRTPSHPST